MSKQRDKLEKKLKLWETPGFLEFLEDAENIPDNPLSIKRTAQMLKVHYQLEITKLDEKASKFKQGDLGL